MVKKNLKPPKFNFLPFGEVVGDALMNPNPNQQAFVTMIMQTLVILSCNFYLKTKSQLSWYTVHGTPIEMLQFSRGQQFPS